MEKINIQFTLFSAFYSPLIAAISGGFLRDEGLDAHWSVAKAPKIDSKVLADCIATYQRLGNWSPHIEITEPAYEATLDIYAYAGGLQQRHAYDLVCCKPPLV